MPAERKQRSHDLVIRAWVSPRAALLCRHVIVRNVITVCRSIFVVAVLVCPTKWARLPRFAIHLACIVFAPLPTKGLLLPLAIQ